MISASIDNPIHIYLYRPHFWLSGAIAVMAHRPANFLQDISIPLRVMASLARALVHAVSRIMLQMLSPPSPPFRAKALILLVIELWGGPWVFMLRGSRPKACRYDDGLLPQPSRGEIKAQMVMSGSWWRELVIHHHPGNLLVGFLSKLRPSRLQFLV